MPRLADAAAVGERPQRVEAPLVDRDLLLGADLAGPGLDGQRRLPGAPAHAHLDAVGRDRQVALLDALAGVLGELRRQLGDQELALDLDAGGRPIRMEHYAACRRTPIELLLPPSLDRAAAVALLAKRLTLEVGRARTRGPGPARQLRRPAARRGPAGRAPARARAGGVLTVHEPGAPVRRVEVEPARRAIWRASCPAGPVRRRLAEVLEMRALLPVVRAAQRACCRWRWSTATPRRWCGS